MSITQAMYAGASALTNLSESITVIGNNLANSNTTAFKSSAASFEDVLIQTVGNSGAGRATQVGTGMGLAGVQQNMTQGSFAPSVNVTDMSIDGNGFFKVRDPTGTVATSSTAQQDMFYTRAGSFKQDRSGHLVNASGLILQGRKVNDQGGLDTIGDITLPGPIDKLNAQATTLVTAHVNLDTSTQLIDPGTTWLADDPSTYNFSTSVRVFDSLGFGHSMDLQFRKESDTTWQWQAVLPAGELANGTPGDTTKQILSFGSPLAGAPYEVGKLVFDDHGRLSMEGSAPMEVTFSQGATPQQILVDFGQAVGTNGDATNDYTKDRLSDPLYAARLSAVKADTSTSSDSGTTSVFGGFSTTKLDQNGYSTGTISKISIDPTGVISGSYTNSQTKKLYQIGLVEFADPAALEQKGGNLFAETISSGQPLPGLPKDSGFGSIVSNALEQSNVDMSGEFVRMIATQRGFQANSRIVSVVDGMMEELLSLKR
ncbi:MAG: flagellar hook protein FlgE [Magnetococcus sp. DMHC-8]